MSDNSKVAKQMENTRLICMKFILTYCTVIFLISHCEGGELVVKGKNKNSISILKFYIMKNWLSLILLASWSQYCCYYVLTFWKIFCSRFSLSVYGKWIRRAVNSKTSFLKTYLYKHETILHNINKIVIFSIFIKKIKAHIGIFKIGLYFAFNILFLPLVY